MYLNPYYLENDEYKRYKFKRVHINYYIRINRYDKRIDLIP